MRFSFVSAQMPNENVSSMRIFLDFIVVTLNLYGRAAENRFFFSLTSSVEQRNKTNFLWKNKTRVPISVVWFKTWQN